MWCTMKHIFILFVLSLFLLSPRAYGSENLPRWQTLTVDKNGTNYQYSKDLISAIDKSGNFTFVVRGIFQQPTVLEIDETNRVVAVALVMVVDAECFTRKSVIVNDFLIKQNGERAFENELTKRDTLSEVHPNSIHAMMMDIVCGKKGTNV